MTQKEIPTPRLLLRPLQKGDEAAVMQLLRCDAVKATYMIPDLTEAEAKALFARYYQLSKGKERFLRAISSEGRFIGWIHDTEICDTAMELGWALLPSDWGRGYATEAVKAAIGALQAVGFGCVYAGAFAENKASLRVMQKAGMHLMDKTEQLEYRGKCHTCLYYEIYL